MIRGLVIALAALIPLVSGLVLRRFADRVIHAPRRTPDEARLGPDLDRLGGEVVRMRSRDGLRLAGRWLPTTPDDLARAADGAGDRYDPDLEWGLDPHEAVLVLHGWSGSVAPDLVEYGPFLRRTASVLGLDMRGHGDSEYAPTTFGMCEVEDVAGALAWLGDRGVTRVALFGTSMGGITALASIAVLGDGRLAAADDDPDAPRVTSTAPRPVVVGVVADSVAPALRDMIAAHVPGPLRGFVADRVLGAVARRLGGDPRATEPRRVVALLERTPLLLVNGDRDPEVRLDAARRLVAAAPAGTRHLVVPGAGHATAHRTSPERYEADVTAFLRDAFRASREAPASAPILSADEPLAVVSVGAG